MSNESYEQMVKRHKQWFYDWAILFLYLGCFLGCFAVFSIPLMVMSAVAWIFSLAAFYLSWSWK